MKWFLPPFVLMISWQTSNMPNVQLILLEKHRLPECLNLFAKERGTFSTIFDLTWVDIQRMPSECS